MGKFRRFRMTPLLEARPWTCAGGTPALAARFLDFVRSAGHLI